jgi:hypothetical protein
MRLNFTDATFLDITIASEEPADPPFCGDDFCDAGETSCSCTADCGAPDASGMPVLISGMSLSVEANDHPILTFQAASGAGGYNVYRSDDRALSYDAWPQVGSNASDMDAAMPDVQWIDESGDVASEGIWYYRVMAVCSP